MGDVTPAKGFPPRREPIFVGIAGGTASGKTTVCEMVF